MDLVTTEYLYGIITGVLLAILMDAIINSNDED